MKPDRESSQEGVEPFRVVCPGCGADSDAPEKAFWTGYPAFPAHADYALTEVRCLTCDTTLDLCLWLINKDEVLRNVEAAGTPPERLAPEVVAILDRYLRMVEEKRAEWEGFYGREEELPEIDLSDVDLELSDQRFTAMPARVLAVARGLRKAVAAHHGENPPGGLRIGHFTCVLSFDEGQGGMRPHTLHLSVMNNVTPGTLSEIEREFVLSLFFTPGERPFLWAEEGHEIPVIHYYLGADSPELNEC